MDYVTLAISVAAFVVAVLSALYIRRSNDIAIFGDFLREFRQMDLER